MVHCRNIYTTYCSGSQSESVYVHVYVYVSGPLRWAKSLRYISTDRNEMYLIRYHDVSYCYALVIQAGIDTDAVVDQGCKVKLPGNISGSTLLLAFIQASSSS